MIAMALDHGDERPAPRYLPVLRSPVTRAECVDGPRPCPHSTCRYHLDADVHSCALDVADLGPQVQDTIGTLLGVTKERARQIEAQALRKLHARFGRAYLEEIFERIHPEGEGIAADGEPDVDAPREATEHAVQRPVRNAKRPRHSHTLADEKAIVDHLTQHGPTHRMDLLPLVPSKSALAYAVANLRTAGVLTGGGTRHHPIPYRLVDPSSRDATEEA